MEQPGQVRPEVAAGTTASIAHIFCLDARYQPVTTAESARRVDETPNHFGTVLRCPAELALSVDDGEAAPCASGSTWIDKDLLDELETYFDDNEIEFYAFEHRALFHTLRLPISLSQPMRRPAYG